MRQVGINDFHLENIGEIKIARFSADTARKRLYFGTVRSRDKAHPCHAVIPRSELKSPSIFPLVAGPLPAPWDSVFPAHMALTQHADACAFALDAGG
jgi:hypothetical protein